MDLKECIGNINQAIIKTYTIPVEHYNLERLKEVHTNLANLKENWVTQYESFLIYDTPEKEVLKKRIELIEKKLDEWLFPYTPEEIEDIIKFQNPDKEDLYKSYLENIPVLINSIAFAIGLNLNYIKTNYLKGEIKQDCKNKTQIKLTRVEKIKKVLIDFAEEIQETQGKGRLFVAALCYLSNSGITERFSYQGIKDFIGANLVEMILAKGTFNSHWYNLKGKGGDILREQEINLFREKFKSLDTLKLKRVNSSNL